SAYLFHQGQKDDINVRGAFLHLLVDALVSVGVVVSGGIIALTGWTLADPIISLVIAGVILLSTWSLLSESTKLLLDGVPKQIHKEEIETLIRTFPGVASVHHLHVWALSSAQNALTVHLVLKEGMALHDFQKAELKHALAHHHIGHTTFEIEEAGTECADKTCC
ncbi:MAG: cation diffusion facilitator family transporter, partial [Alloprevotella sp.]